MQLISNKLPRMHVTEYVYRDVYGKVAGFISGLEPLRYTLLYAAHIHMPKNNVRVMDY